MKWQLTQKWQKEKQRIEQMSNRRLFEEYVCGQEGEWRYVQLLADELFPRLKEWFGDE